MDEYLIQGQTLTDIADAIREKTETEEQMSPQDMPQKIRSINFVLQIMSPDVLGGGKAKTKDAETIQVAVDPETGFLYVPDQSFVLEQATEAKLGGVKAKQRTDESIEVAIDPSTGKLYVPQQGGGGSYILPVATSSVLGGVKVKNKTDETVQVAADEQGFLYIKDYALKNEIPEKLPNPQPLTFTGAATGTYDGSSPLEINIPSGGGGGGEFDINTATPSFTEAESRENINTGETIPVLFGKIKKWFTDLKAVAFSGNYSDLTGRPQALKNPQAITFTGAVSETYDGSESKTINIPTGGTGTTDYNALSNKPSIGGVTIEGNKTAEDYGLAAKEELPKQATDTVAGIAKFQPIEQQGSNVPASILPDGTVVVPSGGGGGGEGISPTLLATLNGDGESFELTADVDLKDGLYAFGGGIPENTPDDNKGQTLYAKIGDTGIFGKGIRLAPMLSNASIGSQNEVVTIYVKNNAMYVCGAFSAGANKNPAMVFKPDGVPIAKQKIALYSQTSKPVPVGAYAMLWRLG